MKLLRLLLQDETMKKMLQFTERFFKHNKVDKEMLMGWLHPGWDNQLRILGITDKEFIEIAKKYNGDDVNE